MLLFICNVLYQRSVLTSCRGGFYVCFVNVEKDCFHLCQAEKVYCGIHLREIGIMTLKSSAVVFSENRGGDFQI